MLPRLKNGQVEEGLAIKAHWLAPFVVEPPLRMVIRYPLMKVVPANKGATCKDSGRQKAVLATKTVTIMCSSTHIVQSIIVFM
jgi:hypothetical protein